MNRTWRSNYHSNVTAGRCHFVKFLGIMLNIFIENKRIRFCICINVKQQHLFPVVVFLFVLALRMRVSNTKSTQVPHEQHQNSTMWKL